jgi:hypothetical protein
MRFRGEPPAFRVKVEMESRDSGCPLIVFRFSPQVTSFCGRLPDSLFCAIHKVFGNDTDGGAILFHFPLFHVNNRRQVQAETEPETANWKLKTKSPFL